MTERRQLEAAKIMSALAMALAEQDMKAAAALLRLLAIKDPHSAELILAALDARTVQAATP